MTAEPWAEVAPEIAALLATIDLTGDSSRHLCDARKVFELAESIDAMKDLILRNRGGTVLLYIIYVSAAIIIIAALVLGYLNRESKDLIQTVSVIVGGVLVSTITMHSYFKNEEHHALYVMTFLTQPSEIPVDPFLDAARQTLPEYKPVLDRQRESYAMFRVTALSHPELAFNLFHGANDSFSDLIAVQALSTVSQRFESGWNAALPENVGILGNESDSLLLSPQWEDASKVPKSVGPSNEFQSNPFASDSKVNLMLPPRTSLKTLRLDNGWEIVISNALVRLTLDIQQQAAVPVILPNASLAKIGLIHSSYNATVVKMDVRSVFSGIRKGDPAMRNYKDWAAELVDVLRKNFDEQPFWKKLAQTSIDSRGSWSEHYDDKPPILKQIGTVSVGYSDSSALTDRAVVGQAVLQLSHDGFGVEAAAWDTDSVEMAGRIFKVIHANTKDDAVLLVADSAMKSKLGDKVLEIWKANLSDALQYRIVTASELLKKLSNVDKPGLVDLNASGTVAVFLPPIE